MISVPAGLAVQSSSQTRIRGAPGGIPPISEDSTWTCRRRRVLPDASVEDEDDNVTMKIHPLASAVPQMLTDEYAELLADIKTHGLRHPLMTFKGMLLDGRHRARACAALKIEPRTIEFTGTEAEAKAYILSANVHRRHLTLEQKHTLIDAELKHDPTQSDRAIARKAKVDHKTVASRRHKAEARGEIPHVSTHTDAVGRNQPATKPATKPKAQDVPGKFNGVLIPVKPIPPPLKTAGDREAQRILDAIAALKPKDVTDPERFAGSLGAQASRFSTKAYICEFLVSCTLGWSNLDMDGQPYPFSSENAKRLYEDEERDYVREQVLEALNGKALFIRSSSSA